MDKGEQVNQVKFRGVDQREVDGDLAEEAINPPGVYGL